MCVFVCYENQFTLRKNDSHYLGRNYRYIYEIVCKSKRKMQKSTQYIVGYGALFTTIIRDENESDGSFSTQGKNKRYRLQPGRIKKGDRLEE